jgi:hypothetical protein
MICRLGAANPITQDARGSMSSVCREVNPMDAAGAGAVST